MHSNLNKEGFHLQPLILIIVVSNTYDVYVYIYGTFLNKM